MTLTPKLLDLHRRALEHYEGQALWNVPKSADVLGMRAIARALRAEGDMAAMPLVVEIEKELAKLA